MTRLARAANCGAFGVNGLITSPALAAGDSNPVCAIKDANPSAPMPMPHLQRKSRRVRNASWRRGWWCDIPGFVYHNLRRKETEFIAEKHPTSNSQHPTPNVASYRDSLIAVLLCPHPCILPDVPSLSSSVGQSSFRGRFKTSPGQFHRRRFDQLVIAAGPTQFVQRRGPTMVLRLVIPLSIVNPLERFTRSPESSPVDSAAEEYHAAERSGGNFHSPP